MSSALLLATPRPVGTTFKRFGGNSEDRKSLIDAGMLVTNDQGRSYDRFR
jgi:DNA primase